jgi:TonB family protein
MILAKINVEKREDEYFTRRRWIALLFVVLFHCAALFSLSIFGFNRTYPPPPTQGIEIVMEFVPRPQGVPRRNPQQKPVPNPPVVNTPGNTAPESAKLSTHNESTKPAPQPETKPSELSDKGDIPVEAPKPIDNKALFRSDSQGEVEGENPNPVDEKKLFSGVGNAEEASRDSKTDPGPEHRQSITHNLSGRSVEGGFPPPEYLANEAGTVVVEVSVNRDGKITSARAVGKGSTTQNSKLWKAAEEAAFKAKFNVKKDAPISQTGTITYVFSLK